MLFEMPRVLTVVDNMLALGPDGAVWGDMSREPLL
jgi:hypothetical protein